MSRKNDKLKDSLEGLFGQLPGSAPELDQELIPEKEPLPEEVKPEQKASEKQNQTVQTETESKEEPAASEPKTEKESSRQSAGQEPSHPVGGDQDPVGLDQQPEKKAAGSESDPAEEDEQQRFSLDFEAGERVVVFTLENEDFGIDIYSIRTLVKPQDIFPVPHMPDYLIGLTNLRGEIVPVIDLRSRLGLPELEYSENTRFVVAEKRNEPICLVVDNVNGIEYFPPGDLEEPSNVISSVDTTYLHAIGKSDQDLVLLLDLDQVLGQRILEENK